MDKKKITIEQLNDHLWLMDDNGESTGFIVIGEERVLIIDTMNGTENVKEIAERITSLPLTVVNTHVHPDHIGGNHYFKECYIHPNDIPFVEEFTAPENRDKIPKMLPVREGDCFDLGGLHVDVYDLPGHSPGELCLLLREKRILFSGDGINHHLWMQLDDCCTLKEYLSRLHRLDFLKEKADFILHAHTSELESIALFDMVEKGIEELVNQSDMEITDKDEAYYWFGGVGKIHVYAPDGSAICYRKENIR